MDKEFDLVILGGGSAAFSAAIKATALGAEVAVCEELVIGGTCLNRGCIPSKNLLKASEVFYYSHHQPFKGIKIPEGNLDFAEVINQKDELVQELRKEKYLNILRENGKIHYMEGKASFQSEDSVKVGDRVLKGKRFLIATGASPQGIPFKGIENVDYLTSTTSLDLKRLPSSMVILGGRFVAVDVISSSLDMSHVPKARAIRDTRGLIKIVAEKGTGRILGIHILAPEAAEVIHQAVLFVKNRMTLKEATEKIDIYPTLSEMLKLFAQR